MLVAGALMACIGPKLAADSAFKLPDVLAGVDEKNYKGKKNEIVLAIEAMVKAKTLKLAKDADLSDVVALLDRLEGENPVDDPTVAAVDLEPGVAATAGDPCAEVIAMLKGKVPDDVLAMVEQKLRAGTTGDVDPEEAKKKAEAEELAKKTAADNPMGGAQPGGKENDMKNMVSKPAMDAAIAAAVTQARKETVENLRSVAEAEEAVKPYVGKLAVAFDSAAEVYKAALENLGIDIAGMHQDAYRSVLLAQPKPGEQHMVIARDAAPAKGFAERFPNANRLNG